MAMRLYKIRHAAKYAAHRAMALAIERGQLIKADACERCGGFGPLSGHHHHGYAHEHWFDVIWICSACHWREHHSIEDWREANRKPDPVSAEEYLLLLCPEPVGRPRLA